MAMFGSGGPFTLAANGRRVAVYRRLGRARSAIRTEIALPLLPLDRRLRRHQTDRSILACPTHLRLRLGQRGIR